MAACWARTTVVPPTRNWLARTIPDSQLPLIRSTVRPLLRSKIRIPSIGLRQARLSQRELSDAHSVSFEPFCASAISPFVRERSVIVLSAVFARLVCLALFDPAASLTSGDSASFLAGSATQAPGYSAFLAVVPFPIVVQSVVTILLALLVHARLPRAGFLAAMLIATSPFFAAFEFRILSDSLSWQFVLAGFLLIAFPKANWEIPLAGIMLGCAALVRDSYHWLPLFALPFAFRIPRRMTAAAIVAYLVIVPWQLGQGRVAISEGRLGYNLWLGTWERNSDWMAKGIANADYPPEAFANPGQEAWLFEQPMFTPQSDQRFRQAAIDRIKSDPGPVLTNWVMRYPRLWLGTRSDQIAWRIDGGPLWYAVKAGLWALNLLILLLGAIGIALHWRRYPLLLAPIAYVALVYLPFHNTETRYSLGALPFVMIFAAQAIQSGVSRAKASRLTAQQGHARSSAP